MLDERGREHFVDFTYLFVILVNDKLLVSIDLSYINIQRAVIDNNGPDMLDNIKDCLS